MTIFNSLHPPTHQYTRTKLVRIFFKNLIAINTLRVVIKYLMNEKKLPLYIYLGAVEWDWWWFNWHRWQNDKFFLKLKTISKKVIFYVFFTSMQTDNFVAVKLWDVYDYDIRFVIVLCTSIENQICEDSLPYMFAHKYNAALYFVSQF